MPPKEDRAEYVERNFDGIARNYDRFNDLATFGLHRLWKRATISYLTAGASRPVRMLDICCGTGDIALLAAGRLPAGSQLVAIDFSREMLNVLATRLQASPGSVPVELRRGDATDLAGVPDASQDAISIGFGLRNVQDRAACLRECRRVLHPDGRLAILDVGRVRLPIIRSLHGLFFEHMVPWIGYLVEGRRNEMYAYLPASAREYPAQDELAEELRAAGFARVDYRNFLFGSVALHMAGR